MTGSEIIARYREARSRLWPKTPPKPVELQEPEPDLTPEERRPKVPAEALFDWRKPFSELCLRYGVSPTLVLSEYRGWKAVAVRAEMSNLLWHRGWSKAAIGRLLKRDHTTIMNLLEKYKWGSPALDGLRSKHDTFNKGNRRRHNDTRGH